MDEKRREVEGCDREVRAKGKCEPHYSRERKFGDVHEDCPIGDKSGRFR